MKIAIDFLGRGISDYYAHVLNFHSYFKRGRERMIGDNKKKEEQVILRINYIIGNHREGKSRGDTTYYQFYVFFCINQ